MRNVFYFSKKVRLFSQNDVLFLFYFLINPAGTTGTGTIHVYNMISKKNEILFSETFPCVEISHLLLVPIYKATNNILNIHSFSGIFQQKVILDKQDVQSLVCCWPIKNPRNLMKILLTKIK